MPWSFLNNSICCSRFNRILLIYLNRKKRNLSKIFKTVHFKLQNKNKGLFNENNCLFTLFFRYGTVNQQNQTVYTFHRINSNLYPLVKVDIKYIKLLSYYLVCVYIHSDHEYLVWSYKLPLASPLSEVFSSTSCMTWCPMHKST